MKKLLVLTILLVASPSMAEEKIKIDPVELDQTYLESREYFNRTCNKVQAEYEFPVGVHCSADYVERILQQEIFINDANRFRYKAMMSYALIKVADLILLHNPTSTWGNGEEKVPVDLEFEID